MEIILYQIQYLGTIDKIKSFKREKIVKFIEEKYTPYNSVISICGKFDDDELRDLIEKYFGTMGK